MPNSYAYGLWVPRAPSLGSNGVKSWWGHSNHPTRCKSRMRSPGQHRTCLRIS